MQLYADAESVLRAAGLAVLMGHHDFTSSYLNDMAKEYEHRAGFEKPNAARDRSSNPLHFYGFMRALWQTRRHQATAAVFRDLARELASLGPRK